MKRVAVVLMATCNEIRAESNYLATIERDACMLPRNNFRVEFQVINAFWNVCGSADENGFLQRLNYTLQRERSTEWNKCQDEL
jgi:hypothetical protein